MHALQANQPVFQADNLSWIMAGLIVFVVVTVLGFSKRYMAGDRNHARHVRDIVLLCAGVLVTVFADHLLALLAGWGVSNLLLVRLMVHKKEWRAARNAGRLALATFGSGMAMLAGGFWLLADATGSASIHTLLSRPVYPETLKLTVALVLIAVAAFTQSAVLPFHKWLTSSLNSPVPVSALMHAGLVNGGGFLLVRFAPLYLAQPGLLHIIFLAGLITAVTGTLWKLLQTDIKRMLACSTMGQMGFMVMQCGMGLFPLAVSHLVWHGLFKAYLFLASGSVLRETRPKDRFSGITFTSFGLSCLFGLGGVRAFALVTGNAFTLEDTGALMIALVFMTAAQSACNLLARALTLPSMLAALIMSVGGGVMYGISVRLVESALAPLNIMAPQPLDAVYVTGFTTIFLIWLLMNMNVTVRLQGNVVWKRLYMAALNGSQPHPSTITSSRTSYQF